VAIRVLPVGYNRKLTKTSTGDVNFMSKKEIVVGLASRLKLAREAVGLSQQDAADKSGVHQVSIARFETDERVPTLATLYKLAEAYGVNVCELLPGGKLPPGEEKPPSKKGKK
jgi:ribosome-binding protein aMBF1 (putative translation factor)